LDLNERNIIEGPRQRKSRKQAYALSLLGNSVITEHLDLSLVQIDFDKHQLEEWEIATITVQVESRLHIGAAFLLTNIGP
jgi:hypothetical protein